MQKTKNTSLGEIIIGVIVFMPFLIFIAPWFIQMAALDWYMLKQIWEGILR